MKEKGLNTWERRRGVGTGMGETGTNKAIEKEKQKALDLGRWPCPRTNFEDRKYFRML